MLAFATSSNTDDTDNELADQHAQGAPDQNRTSTEALNDPEGNRSRADIHECSDQRDEERVADCAKLLEEGGTEVEDEVDTSPLLHHLKGCAENGTSQIGRWRSKPASETTVPGHEVTTLWDDRYLVFVVGDDFSQFSLNKLGSLWFTAKTGQDLNGLVELAFLDEITWRLGEEEETNGKNDGPEHLNRNWDTVGARISAVLGAIVDTGSEQNADSNTELVSGN